MHVILEQPWCKAEIGLFARKNGKYTRPIAGSIIDFRIEDMGIPKNTFMKEFNYIGKLPNISELNQIDKYFICTFNNVTSVEASYEEVSNLIKNGHYILLPDSEQSSLWEYTKCPWWEFAYVLDNDYEYIKAPKIHRSGEPSPEEVDEMLDDYEENRLTLHVHSPKKLNKLQLSGVRESYIERLNRI